MSLYIVVGNNMNNLESLINKLCSYSDELPWVEFKCDNYNPDMIGADISALANGAALDEKPYAYFLWGIEDETHNMVGTNYNLQNLKKGNEELENWLRRMLSNNADFEYETISFPKNVKIGVMKIASANSRPVTFQKTAYIRVGSYTKKLQDYPSLQARLWNRLSNKDFETMTARENMSPSEVLQFLDYGAYFDLAHQPVPTTVDNIIHYLAEEQIVKKQDDGLYAITNMGAILFAKNINEFPTISRKAIRVIQYDGNNRISMLKEDVGKKGYAVGMEGLIRYIEALIPSKEVISNGIRETKMVYPSLAIREIVANALIHQDFSISGVGPTIELFSNRIEATNPGEPLIEIDRIIDNPPKSRNEKLAALMRRLGMCEELGTGWDKIVNSCEIRQLPAPKIEIYDESTRVTLYANIPYSNLKQEDKLRSCYMHACVQYIQEEYLTNSSLRTRFGVPNSSSGSISRLIKEAVERGLIKPLDPNTSNKYMKYVPYWA